MTPQAAGNATRSQLKTVSPAMSGLPRAIASLRAARHEGVGSSQAMLSAPPIAIFFRRHNVSNVTIDQLRIDAKIGTP